MGACLGTRVSRLREVHTGSEVRGSRKLQNYFLASQGKDWRDEEQVNVFKGMS